MIQKTICNLESAHIMLMGRNYTGVIGVIFVRAWDMADFSLLLISKF